MQLGTWTYEHTGIFRNPIAFSLLPSGVKRSWLRIKDLMEVKGFREQRTSAKHVFSHYPPKITQTGRGTFFTDRPTEI
jgi:hypothetical protein